MVIKNMDEAPKDGMYSIQSVEMSQNKSYEFGSTYLQSSRHATKII